MLTAALTSGKPLAIVCHAPAAMLATRIHGVSPLAGYQVTAFTNEEENAVGLGPKARWLVEDELIDVGVDFTTGEIWKSYKSSTATSSPDRTQPRQASRPNGCSKSCSEPLQLSDDGVRLTRWSGHPDNGP
jgi:hypothetical protein